MRLLEGLRVVDLSGEPAQIAGRILGDLGAEVVLVEPRSGCQLRSRPPFVGASGLSLRFAAWAAGKVSVVAPGAGPGTDKDTGTEGSVPTGPTSEELAGLFRHADVVIAMPGWPGSTPVDDEWRKLARDAVWVDVTPFGARGPRSAWRASDIGVMASTGNMYATGDPDRAPVTCSEPASFAHVGPEVVLAALTALASGLPQHVDVSMQEVVMVASMCAPARAFRSGSSGRRSGASIGRTKEIWLCKDGYVSFGLRGGRARAASLELITRLVSEAGLGTPALVERDWSNYNHNAVSDAELRAIEAPIGAYFMTKTMAELYEIACETNLMLAPACSPREICESAQLEFRSFFAPLAGARKAPRDFIVMHEPGFTQPSSAVGGDGAGRTELTPGGRRGVWSREEASPGPVPDLGAGPMPEWARGSGKCLSWRSGGTGEKRSARAGHAGMPDASAGGAWEGTRIVELGSGAAGPIATRYFVENGATVVRIESRTRPDFLRTYAADPSSGHGLDGSDMFDGLNAGKLSVTLNLKHPEGNELARKLIGWADAVAENFAPRAMRSLGLDYDSLVSTKPDLVMLSTCLQGQTGPHRDYPGFGGQGAALSGYNFLTGWPDREPLGPAGTITDSLAPRFSAAALAAALMWRRWTGKGVRLDLSQVEAAVYSLSPWIMDYSCNGHISSRAGNRSAVTAPHGVFRCRGVDRWIAIATWSDEEWLRLREIMGISDESFDRLDDRMARTAELEALISSWTEDRDRDEVAELLQASGIEAVPVQDFVDVLSDPQLSFRGHFVEMVHPVMGKGVYERNGFRLSCSEAGYSRTGPTLGQDTAYVLGDILGLSASEQARLEAQGALE